MHRPAPRTLLSSLALAGTALLLIAPVSHAGRDMGELMEISGLEDRRSLGNGRLAELLTDDDAETRAAAARAFGRIGANEGVQPLISRLTDPELAVRREVIFALGQIGDAAARDALVRIAGSNADGAERDEAVLALGKLEGDGAAEAILPFLGDANPRVRADAAIALARTGDAVAANDLRSLLADKEPSVRTAAAWAIGRLEATELSADVRPLLDDADPDVRRAAIKAIGTLRDSTVVEALARHAGDPDWRTRAEVAIALGRTGRIDALEAIAGLTMDPNVHVRAAAASGLRWIPEGLERDDVIIPMADDSEAEVRGAAMTPLAVGQENRYSSMEEHFLRLDDSSLYVRDKAAESFAEASRRMKDADEMTQWRTAVMFFLRSRMIQEDAAVRERISDAYHVGAFQGMEPWPRPDLLELLPSSIHPAFTAAAIHSLCTMQPLQEKDALRHRIEMPGILASVQEESPYANDRDVRLAVAEGVGEFSGEKAQQLARHYLDDPDPFVRGAAAASLEKMGVSDVEATPAGPLPGDPEPLDDVYLKSRAGRFKAIVTTNRGQFEIELLNREAPRTVQNFVTLAEDKFFNGRIVHRVVPDFVMQTGCPIGNGWGDPGYLLRCEYNPERYERGMVGMAHAGKDTGGSQWFVTHSAQRHLDGRYTVFGRVTSGMDVVDELRVEDRIESVEIKKALF
jgi:peptidylprolyl isomerase